jgi:uncharacterized membrane protein
VKELFQRRPLGVPIHHTMTNWTFALLLGSVVLDLLAWFGLGTRDTTGTNVGAYAVLIAAVVASALAVLAALAAALDLPDDLRGLGRTYTAILLVLTLLQLAGLYLRNATLRDQVVPPMPLFLSLATLLGMAMAAWLGGLIAAREVEDELEEEYEEPEPIRRRRSR